mgnify:CR=1 FL=1
MILNIDQMLSGIDFEIFPFFHLLWKLKWAFLVACGLSSFFM